MNNNKPLYLAWFIAMTSMLGSLYFSEVMKLPPCILCWYQRILMYPLVIIIPVGILNIDKKVYKYVQSLSVVGIAIAFYHYLLYVKILPDTYAPCSTGVSCTTKLIEWFGFINIPFLSLVSFTLITCLMIYYSKQNKND